MSTFAEGFIKYGLDKGHIKPKEEDQKELDLIWASSFYLTEDLPKNFGKWSEKKLNKFLVDHAWQPFEYYEADDVWEYIERLADQGRTYFERNRMKLPASERAAAIRLLKEHVKEGETLYTIVTKVNSDELRALD
jgi:hypothetical protein